MKYLKDINVINDYDVVVCGGGFSGFSAAYSAAREGAKVALIERNGALGGVGTLGLVNHILGVRAYENGVLKSCVAGVFAQIERRMLDKGYGVDARSIDPELNPHGWKRSLAAGFIFDNEQMKALLEQMLSEVGVKLLYYTDVIDVIRQDEHIEGVVIYNKCGLALVRGKCFVDATGDGDICALAGCPFNMGDEEGGLSAASLEMHVENVDSEALTEYMRSTGDVRFKAIIERLKREGEWPFAYSIFISVRLMQDDVYMINTIRQVGVDGTDVDSMTRATVSGRQENLQLLEVMRKYFPGFGNATLRGVAPVIGIRETRRIKSRYDLGVDDVIRSVDFEDGIALSGYGWDMPDPKDPSHQPYEGVARASCFTQIPYRALLPIGADNLIAVGRCIGVEREALGVVRVMGPCIAMGECAGIAAKMALVGDGCFANVNTDELRKKIIERGGMVDRSQVC